jgi:hypothetical protein
MSLRTFIDTDGVAWEVWAVRLSAAERREGGDRRARRTDAEPDLGDRRSGDRRRLRDHLNTRSRLAERYAGGWLAFESSVERRRLAPIPPGWHDASDDELAEMCASASANVGWKSEVID